MRAPSRRSARVALLLPKAAPLPSTEAGLEHEISGCRGAATGQTFDGSPSQTINLPDCGKSLTLAQVGGIVNPARPQLVDPAADVIGSTRL